MSEDQRSVPVAYGSIAGREDVAVPAPRELALELVLRDIVFVANLCSVDPLLQRSIDNAAKLLKKQ